MVESHAREGMLRSGGRALQLADVAPDGEGFSTRLGDVVRDHESPRDNARAHAYVEDAGAGAADASD